MPLSSAAASLTLLGLCAGGGALATAGARWLSHRTGILDQPGERKIHREPIAYLGGLGFSAAVMAGVALWAWLCPLQAALESGVAAAFLAGLLAIFLVGLWDDVAGMRPVVKLAFQGAVAAALWTAGVRIERVTIGLGAALDLAGPASLLVTIFWYAALMNAINLIDGLDGLAGGVSFLAALSLAAVGLIVYSGAGLTLGMALPLIGAGACLGFLFHNWHPARIFLGDSGSMSIGYTLATAALLSSTKAPALLALLVPMVALGLPLFESGYSFLRRALTGQSPFKADRRHLHHRLMETGLSQQRVVGVFLYATLYLGVNAVLMARARSGLLLVNVVLLGGGLLMLIEYLSFFEKRRNGAKAPERLDET